MIEVRQLRQFVAAAEELHFTRAAERLGNLMSTATKTLGALTPDTLGEGHKLSEGGKVIGKIVLPGIGNQGK